ncbi:MAG: 50S ribosomal protein L24 [Candidatus Aenigmarchaeota archaeon]|nr:50S ribosomal protein L24 [Candidatus Aenigmarchaeota archaeon]
MMSTKPNVQRRDDHQADLSQRRDVLAAHLSKELRKQYKRRSMSLRKGDEVKIIRGEHFGKVGEIVDIDLKKYMIFVNGVTIKRTVGTEKQVAIEPSNVVITSMKLDDNMRQRILLRKVKEVVVPKKEVKVEPKVEAKTEIAVASDAKAEHDHSSHAGHDHAGHDHASHDHAGHDHVAHDPAKSEKKEHPTYAKPAKKKATTSAQKEKGY